MNLWRKIWWRVKIDILVRKIYFINRWNGKVVKSTLTDWDLLNLQHPKYRRHIISKHFNWRK